ncbi:MAG TPA: L-histidine N(alpha)-methyltransferase, partial [Verrucomicrobiae bacterium]|nr:L-histidine N(alpha)-methyltransferase [Verrucomicrobiae bacterium]
LATAEDLGAIFDAQTPADFARLITFFGMIPNFEPQMILPRLASLIRPGDHLLFSANLAPGADYAAGVKQILPLYDNALTRDWLMTFLTDLGVDQSDGELRFGIENDPAGSGLKRIAAHFHFSKAREIRLDEEAFQFRRGESIQLFFSYRHTPEHVKSMLAKPGLKVIEQWIAKSGEDGVFLITQIPNDETPKE